MTAVGDTQRFELTRFLEGRTQAWGIFEDRFGNVRATFSVEMKGGWQGGDAFVLEERFVYGDGAVEERTWRVSPSQDGRFTATCVDCAGAAQGACNANTIRMRYKLYLNMKGWRLLLEFDDRIHRMTDEIAINRATLRKWGVKLGELSIVFVRQDGAIEGNGKAA